MFRLLSKPVLSAARAARVPTARPVLARAYHEKVISHYENPRNVSSRPGPRPDPLGAGHGPPPSKVFI
jgi:iron-sulfur cluster assembly enzyme ISCU, mitochondrial